MPSLHRHPSPSPISPQESNLYSKGLSKQFRVLPVSELYDKVSSSCNTLMPISISSLIQIIFLPTKQGTSAGAGLQVSSQDNPPEGGHNPLSQGKRRVRKPSGLSSSQPFLQWLLKNPASYRIFSFRISPFWFLLVDPVELLSGFYFFIYYFFFMLWPVPGPDHLGRWQPAWSSQGSA